MKELKEQLNLEKIELIKVIMNCNTKEELGRCLQIASGIYDSKHNLEDENTSFVKLLTSKQA